MRQWAYEIVYGTMEQKQYSDRLFHKIVKKKGDFSAQEKRFLKRLSYGTIERCVELDAILAHFSKVPPIPTPITIGGHALGPAASTVSKIAFFTPSIPSAGFSI